jgi:PAS domain S-box-containing protein
MQGDGINILMVEDSPTHARIIRESLQIRDKTLNLTLATTLAEARRLLAETTPDLILCDINLPDGKGTDLLSPDDDSPSLPLVVLTGQGDEQVAVEALKAGALDYVVKSPAVLKDMPHIIDRSLREWRLIQERRQAVDQATRFGRLLDAAHNEIFTFDVETLRFIQVNLGARKNLGYTMDELRLLTPLDLQMELSAKSFAKLLAPLRSGAMDRVYFCTTHRRKDGTSYPIEVHLQLSPLDSAPAFVAVILDISERHQAEEALRLSEERFRSVFQTVAAGMAVIDRSGNLIQVNPSICRYLNYPEQELLKLSVFDITHPDDREETRRYYEDLLGNRCPMINMEKRYLRKSGETIWGHVSVACVPEPDGPPHYCVGLLKDITDRKRAEEKLLEINSEMDAFVRTVSHDLRTPLTPIIGYAQFLKNHCRKQLDQPAMECINNIEEMGQRMLALLEDLLILSQVGHLQKPKQPVPCGEVLREVLQMLEPRIAEEGIAVEVRVAAAIQLPRTLLTQLFANLIDNAINYGEGRGGTIEVGEKSSDGLVAFYVCDHGEGIPETERERIFEVFYRGSSGKKVGGTGVGLATVRRIANLYGGRAWVEETSGGGSTFWVEFPTPEDDPDGPARDSTLS